MGILSFLGAKLLPDTKPPSKLPSKSVAIPVYLGTSKGAKISNTGTNTTSIDRSVYARNAGNMNDVVANLVRVSPDLSNAVATKISTAISKSYTVVAYDEVGRIDVKGTEAAQAFVQRLDTQAPDYSQFTRFTDIRSLCSSLILDSVRYGGMTSELILGVGRMPAYIRPVNTAKIEWADNLINAYPIYKSKTGDVELNYSTIFYSATQQDMSTPYSESPMQTAIQPALWDAELTDHLRRAAHKNLLQRLVVTIDSEQWNATLPLEVQNDKDLRDAYAAKTVAALEAQLAGLEPEDSLVIFSTLGVDTEQDSNRSEDKSIKVLNDIISGQISSGSKILPSVIGRGESSTASSTEAMLFLKAAGFMQLELDVMLSRIFTLALRLFGHEVSVKFKFEDVNLKPEVELESFKTIKQSRLLRELSLGMRSDEEVCIELTGSVPPAGYKPLTGTMFEVAKADTSDNNYSNTSAADNGKPDSTQSDKEQDK
jgi:hypothetical protein